VKSVYDPQYARILSCLVRARQAAGLTQRDLATALSKPQSFVSKVERGERRLDVLEFLTLCRLLDLDPCSLLTDVEAGA
jgi:transcriptional regulator with XRE-family HTH domain